jgi:hypothetical protein
MNDAQGPRPQHLERTNHSPRLDEDEVALGWECANPVLQIEGWLRDAPPPLAQPLH